MTAPDIDPRSMPPGSGGGRATSSDDALEPKFVDAAQVGAVLGLSRTSVYRMLNSGKLRSVRQGGRRLVPVGELDRLTDSLLAQAR